MKVKFLYPSAMLIGLFLGSLAPFTSNADETKPKDAVTEEARCRPSWIEGKIAGYLCSQIGAASHYYAAGLRSGDLVTSINGTRVTSPATFAKLFDSVDKMKYKEIRVQRANAEVILKPTATN